MDLMNGDVFDGLKWIWVEVGYMYGNWLDIWKYVRCMEIF